MPNFIQSIIKQCGEIHQITINNSSIHLLGEDNYNKALELINEKSSYMKSFCIIRIAGFVKLKVWFDYAE